MGQTEGNVEVHVASEFVCELYGLKKVSGVNEAHHKKLLQMTGKIDEVCVELFI